MLGHWERRGDLSSLHLKFDFEMFEKCKTRTGDGLVVRDQAGRLDLRDHQGGPGTLLALGLGLAGHLGPQDDRGLSGSGVEGLGFLVLPCRVMSVTLLYIALLCSADSPSQRETGYR